MKILIEFLSLRPIFTRHGLQAIWWAYLLATLIQLGLFASFSFSAIGSASPGYHLSLVPPVLFALAHLALVRIFLEMALKFLTTPTLREETRPEAPA